MIFNEITLYSVGGVNPRQSAPTPPVTVVPRVPVHNPWDSPVRPLISSNNSRTVRIDKAKENKIPVALRGMFHENI